MMVRPAVTTQARHAVRADQRGVSRPAVLQVVTGSTGGPSPTSRARTRTWAVAEVFDAAGNRLASVTLSGGDPYGFTAGILSWGARTALDGGLLGTGALGPVEAFGLEALTAGAAEAGLTR
jgi:short subunit dehydrogenase-like uncharacterized protein